MDRALGKYLARHAEPGRRPLEWITPPSAAPQSAVVIPALAEYPGILDTLRDLAANPAHLLAHTAVIIVINNRAPGHAAPGDAENNQACIRALRNGGAPDGLHLAIVDAASPDRELGPREGVGHARKLGMDWAAHLLGEAGLLDAPIICLDADTRVPPNYLESIAAHFAKAPRWGAVIDYDHPKPPAARETPAILAYELYLRYCELGLLYARSPYAYHAIGSAMACSVRAYAAAGGMKRRAAAEDFYFLQALAKTGRITRIWDTQVRPAARVSHRAPIGTGKHVGDFLRQPEAGWRVYHPDTYRILREWLHIAGRAAADAQEAPPDFPPLREFLREIHFDPHWQELRNNGGTPAQRLRQFHTAFDALRTLRAAHSLRDSACPEANTLAAIHALAQMMREDVPRARGSAIVELETALTCLDSAAWITDLDGLTRLLRAMRSLTREAADAAGLDAETLRL